MRKILLSLITISAALLGCGKDAPLKPLQPQESKVFLREEDYKARVDTEDVPYHEGIMQRFAEVQRAYPELALTPDVVSVGNKPYFLGAFVSGKRIYLVRKGEGIEEQTTFVRTLPASLDSVAGAPYLYQRLDEVIFFNKLRVFDFPDVGEDDKFRERLAHANRLADTYNVAFLPVNLAAPKSEEREGWTYLYNEPVKDAFGNPLVTGIGLMFKRLDNTPMFMPFMENWPRWIMNGEETYEPKIPPNPGFPVVRTY